MEVETCPINEAGQRGQLLKITEVGECLKMEIRDYKHFLKLDVKELQKDHAIQNRDENLVLKKYHNVGELDYGKKCVPLQMKL